MHPALCLEEILLNIFGHCLPPCPSWTIERKNLTADLAALARTCRTFKEPALDVLWSDLVDLSPLAFCLPECCLVAGRWHSFTGPRNDAERDTLKSYTRRVWRILGFFSPSGSLDPSAISATFNTQTPLLDPLFPNLRCLIWQGGMVMFPVIHFAAPLLTSVGICDPFIEDMSTWNLLDTILPRCPHIRDIRVEMAYNTNFGKSISHHLPYLQKLRFANLIDVALPIDAIVPEFPP